jgi:predicted MFS family arabinose efflux permease
MPRGFAAFESIPYRWLIGSLLTFFLSMQGGFLVRSLLAWELTSSELSLAYINLVIALPMVFGSFIAGAIIDRVERRRLIIVSQLIVLANESLVLVLLVSGLLDFRFLLGSSFVMGILFPFVMPTRTAMIYGLVGRDKLGNAMALQAATMNVARILGPSLVGILIPLISLKGAYVTSISLYAVSTLMMFKLPKSPPEQKSGKSLLKDMSYSFTYVAKHRDILLCLIFGIFPLLLIMPVYSMLVVFAEEIWKVGETGLGMLMATVGIGGITGSLVVARMGDHNRRALWMVVAAVLFGVLLAAFSISTSFVLALILMLGANMFSNISQTLNNTLIQLLAHNEVRGRMSSLMMLSLGLTPLGVLPVALAAERFGIANTIFTGCLILLAIVLALYFSSPTLRGLDARLAAAHHAQLQQGESGEE